MCCAVWKKISSMQKGVSTVEDWIPKDVETSESETLPTGVCGILSQMDEIFDPLLSDTTPSPPKLNVNVT